MARTFRRHRSAHPIADLNVTNLVDLAFVLLLIFMIATPLFTPEQSMGVTLPIESKSAQPPENKNIRYQIISIDANGAYRFGTTPVSLAELSTRLAVLAAEPEARQPVIRIRGDFNSRLQATITLMDELKKAKLTKVSFDTRTE